MGESMLNMENLEKINRLGRETVECWDVDEVVATVAYVAFYLFNGEYPRNLEEVTDQLRVKLREKGKRLISVCIVDSTLNDLVRMVYDILMSIEEFVDWNERVNGHFVDLDAFGQNVYCQLRNKLIDDLFFEKPYIPEEEA